MQTPFLPTTNFPPGVLSERIVGVAVRRRPSSARERDGEGQSRGERTTEGAFQKRAVNAKDLGTDIERGGEREIFKWFVASILYGKRIRQQIATAAYRVITDHNRWDTPEKLGGCAWQEVVDMLGQRTRYVMTSPPRVVYSSCASS